MAWTRPKIEWEATDYFNASDYNRIVGNVLYLENISSTAIGSVNFANMTESKAVMDMIYADEFNAIESNVRKLNSYYHIDDTVVEFSANGYFPNHDELNRLEALIYMLCVTIKSQISTIPNLAFDHLGRKQLGTRSVEEVVTDEDMYRLSYILGWKGDSYGFKD